MWYTKSNRGKIFVTIQPECCVLGDAREGFFCGTAAAGVSVPVTKKTHARASAAPHTTFRLNCCGINIIVTQRLAALQCHKSKLAMPVIQLLAGCNSTNRNFTMCLSLYQFNTKNYQGYEYMREYGCSFCVPEYGIYFQHSPLRLQYGHCNFQVRFRYGRDPYR